MTTEIIQVRDVPTADVNVLRARAAARGTSLSAYLRELVHRDASRPTIDETLARIADREPVDVDGNSIRTLIEEGRA